MFEWIKGNAYSLNVTLYPSNITLNASAACYFKDIRWVMVGIDNLNKKIAIKPITKREVDLNLVPLQHLHKISIGKGYGRISNKAVIQNVENMLERNLNGIKFHAEFDDNENVLIVDLSKEIG